MVAGTPEPEGNQRRTVGGPPQPGQKDLKGLTQLRKPWLSDQSQLRMKTSTDWYMAIKMLRVDSPAGCPAMSPHKIPWLFPDHFVVFPDHETYRHFITALTLILQAIWQITHQTKSIAITKWYQLGRLSKYKIWCFKLSQDCAQWQPSELNTLKGQTVLWFLIIFYYLDCTKCKFPDFSLTFPKIHFFPWPSTKFPDFSLTFAKSGISLTFPWPLDTMSWDATKQIHNQYSDNTT